MITTIATCGWSSSTSTRWIVAVSIGGAVTSASRSVTCESCSVVARMASSTSRRIALSSTRWAGTGSRLPAARASSAKKRYPRSVGPRPAEVCGCSSRPTSSSRASSARTVDGPQGTSSCSASHLEPTGCWLSTCALTSLRRMNVSREVISTPSNLGAGQLGFGVLDDLVVALGRLEGDHAVLVRRARDHDLLLRQAHPAELDGQSLERARVAARRAGHRTRDLRHRVEPVQDVRRQPDLLGELTVDVDRVEVARRARVAVRQVLVRRHLQLDVHRHTPLTMLVQVPRTTSWPSWLRDTDSNT